jgi:hypothetical protein
MGEFKPMVKMETTEPSVILKLKKGGHVNMKHGKEEHGHKRMASGGMADMMSGSTAAPAMARATMGRRKPMIKPPMPAPAMKKGGRAEGGETKAEHKAEMKAIKGIGKELKSHESKPASKAHKGLKTGGVVEAQGGYKSGGIIKSTKGHTKMDHAKRDNVKPGTGDVKMNKPAGYKSGGAARFVDNNVVGTPPGVTNRKTGDVKLSNAGGYKKGGAAKKHYATGGEVKTGRAVAMPQGAKKPSPPVSIDRLAGTFKKGGGVKC